MTKRSLKSNKVKGTCSNVNRTDNLITCSLSFYDTLLLDCTRGETVSSDNGEAS